MGGRWLEPREAADGEQEGQPDEGEAEHHRGPHRDRSAGGWDVGVVVDLGVVERGVEARTAQGWRQERGVEWGQGPREEPAHPNRG